MRSVVLLFYIKHYNDHQRGEMRVPVKHRSFKKTLISSKIWKTLGGSLTISLLTHSWAEWLSLIFIIKDN